MSKTSEAQVEGIGKLKIERGASGSRTVTPLSPSSPSPLAQSLMAGMTETVDDDDSGGRDDGDSG